MKIATEMYRLPLTQDKRAILQLPVPMDEELWGRMMAILDAMKPGIIVSAATATFDPEASDPGERVTRAGDDERRDER